jgi:hypothetical protein
VISKDDFIRLSGGQSSFSAAELNQLDGQFENAAAAAAQLRSEMPDIGFMSAPKRVNAFISVCRHLDQLVASGRLDESEGQLALIILRVGDSPFLKAVSMFDERASRLDADARADLPRSARQYLAGLAQYG